MARASSAPSSIASRLVRLESRRAPPEPWRAWLGEPVERWPDAALHAFIAASEGVAVGDLSDARLHGMIVRDLLDEHGGPEGAWAALMGPEWLDDERAALLAALDAAEGARA